MSYLLGVMSRESWGDVVEYEARTWGARPFAHGGTENELTIVWAMALFS